jgi:hypothetical protein
MSTHGTTEESALMKLFLKLVLTVEKSSTATRLRPDLYYVWLPRKYFVKTCNEISFKCLLTFVYTYKCPVVFS